MTAPRRRRFRFSLRAMLLVVTFCCPLLGWVGYQLRWIRERNQAIRDYHALRFNIGVGHANTEPPFPLGWFGEQASYGIEIPADAGGSAIARMRGLFPESVVETEMICGGTDGP
jgi:hypothetical protein